MFSSTTKFQKGSIPDKEVTKDNRVDSSDRFSQQRINQRKFYWNRKEAISLTNFLYFSNE
jgi:hypothetical protein